jgi:serine/threonine protein kinase
MSVATGSSLRTKQVTLLRSFLEFFVACIVSALEYVHNKGIIHRDVKPENLVLDNKGFVRLTDFGIARVLKPENFQDTSGTPGYMAPEVMCRQNHGVAVDYFAVGIIAYECMFGKRPYLGRTRREIRDHILSKQVQIRKAEVPRNWSLEAADFVNQMIQRKPGKRLGFRGPEEVKGHPWFAEFDWESLSEGRIDAPFKPKNKDDNFDTKNINEDWKDQDTEKMREN